MAGAAAAGFAHAAALEKTTALRAALPGPSAGEVERIGGEVADRHRGLEREKLQIIVAGVADLVRHAEDSRVVEPHLRAQLETVGLRGHEQFRLVAVDRDHGPSRQADPSRPVGREPRPPLPPVVFAREKSDRPLGIERARRHLSARRQYELLPVGGAGVRPSAGSPGDDRGRTSRPPPHRLRGGCGAEVGAVPASGHPIGGRSLSWVLRFPRRVRASTARRRTPPAVTAWCESARLSTSETNAR